MQAPSASNNNPTPSVNRELLLIVFVHGFKGDDRTFGDFPDRLQHILAESTSNLTVESIVFPAYETKGELNEAVIRFSDWLTTLTVEKEVASGGGSGKASIVLCGHRYTLTCPFVDFPANLRVYKSAWAYLGIHPNVFKNGVTKATEYATAAQTIGSAVFGAFAGLGANKATTSTAQSTAAPARSGWPSWAAPAAYAVGGALLAGAAAGSAYNKREHLSTGLTWATDHMKYVGNLWDEAALTKRVEALMTVKKQAGVTFNAFYTMIPATPPFSAARTFTLLPKRASPQYAYFLPAKNTKALDEVQAHIGMFNAKTNDGYYELGLATAKVIRESLLSQRNTPSQPSEETNPWK
ncbi:hypothetical protein C0989_006785 [Termitomyces sp. Mn162]|nr:hypothetical protein C0989_006785 [Termitomyces sp. Mn162]